MNLDPRNGLALSMVVKDLLNLILTLLSAPGNQSTVTPYTGLNFWDGCVTRLGNRPVTVLTLHLILLHVGYMAELNRLLGLVSTQSLLRAEPAEMVGHVKVPQRGLAVVPDALADAGSRIACCWGRRALSACLRECLSSNNTVIGSGQVTCTCQRYSS